MEAARLTIMVLLGVILVFVIDTKKFQKFEANLTWGKSNLLLLAVLAGIFTFACWVTQL